MSSQSGPILSLRGSAKLVMEFFGFGIQEILYLREIYDPSSFISVKKYGIPLHTTTDPAVQAFLSSWLEQVSVWLNDSHVKQIVMVIQAVESKTPLERWLFNIEVDEDARDCGKIDSAKARSEEDIVHDIKQLLKQITTAVSVLPSRLPRSTFDLLAYTDKSLNVPTAWEVSDAKLIANPEAVALRTFDTRLHRVGAYVVYSQDVENLAP